MSLTLTQEQRLAILGNGGAAVEVADDGIRCYLVAAEEYERMKRLLDAEEIDPSFFEFDDEDFDSRASDQG